MRKNNISAAVRQEGPCIPSLLVIINIGATRRSEVRRLPSPTRSWENPDIGSRIRKALEFLSLSLRHNKKYRLSVIALRDH